jgi:hypothetical protein
MSRASNKPTIAAATEYLIWTLVQALLDHEIDVDLLGFDIAVQVSKRTNWFASPSSTQYVIHYECGFVGAPQARADFVGCDMRLYRCPSCLQTGCHVLPVQVPRLLPDVSATDSRRLRQGGSL